VFEGDEDGQAERGGQANAKPDEAREMGPRGPGEIDKDDATTREASTPSRRATKRAESKKVPVENDLQQRL